jgi:RNA polymerase sigma factor for flagellar operon FliA
MWKEFAQRRTPELRQELALQYLNLVRYVVARSGVRPGNVRGMLEANDLVQVGMIGLLEAIDRFDPARGVKFETYAVTRIRGSIQDELRKLDWVPRSVRRKMRTEQDAQETCNRTLQVGSGYAQVSDYTEELMGDKMDGASSSVENLSTDGSPDLSEIVGMDQLKAMLIQVVEKLPDDDRLIITLYYYEELTFKDIGKIMRLSESRVFQKHAAVMKKLRAHLGASRE